MTLIFLTGTLRSAGVLQAVLTAAPDTATLPAASLRGYAVQPQNPACFPALVPCTDAQNDGEADVEAEGLLLEVSPEDLERIRFYTGSFGATSHSLQLHSAQGPVTALGFVSAPNEQTETAGAQEAGIQTRMAEEVMAFWRRKTASEMGRSLFAIRIRAASWVTMQTAPDDPARDLRRDVIVHAHRREYMNFFVMEEMDLQYRRFDGVLSPVINRGASVVGQAAVVLPYDPARDAVLLIEQFRSAPFLMGDKRPWVWEPPAGLVDPGETPEQAARREAREEAGLEVTHLDYVGALYSSTGALGERVHCYVGLADVSAIEGGGGVPGEGEDIRSKVMSFHDFMDAVDKHTFVDMPLMTTALWLARHRDRLRALWR